MLNRPAHVAISDGSELSLSEPPASSCQSAEMGQAVLRLLPQLGTVFSEVEDLDSQVR